MAMQKGNVDKNAQKKKAAAPSKYFSYLCDYL